MLDAFLNGIIALHFLRGVEKWFIADKELPIILKVIWEVNKPVELVKKRDSVHEKPRNKDIGWTVGFRKVIDHE